MIGVPKSNTVSSAQLLKIVGLAAVYFLAANIGFILPFSGQITTIIWPGTAVSIAALLLFGLKLWPGVLLGAAAVAIANRHSPQLLVGVTIAHTAEIYFSAYLLKKFQFEPTFKSLKDVMLFVGFGALLAPLVGASLGALSFALSPEGANVNLFTLWRQWWIAHSLTILIICPGIFTFMGQPKSNWTLFKAAELVFILSVVLTVSFLIFIRLPFRNLPLGHGLFPFLLWLAIRFQPREVSVASIFASLIAVIGTVNQTGPFSNAPNLDGTLILLHTFIVSVMITALIISVIMTEKKQSEQLLKQSNKTLENRVVARTAEIISTNNDLKNEIIERKKIEKELAVAHGQALNALEIKNQILTNVSHDSRTPLSIIMLYTEMLLRQAYGTITGKQQEALRAISINAEELHRFVDNLVDEARKQADEATVVIEKINVHDWLNDAILPFVDKTIGQGITVEHQIDPLMPKHIKSDINSLTQILRNLVSNAIKFSPEGHVQLAIYPDDQQNWVLQVKDSGIGIAPQNHSRIFEPFWQVDGSITKQVARGVGIGLAVVHHHVHLLNGQIKLKSALGEGTSFIIKFPFELTKSEKIV